MGLTICHKILLHLSLRRFGSPEVFLLNEPHSTFIRTVLALLFVFYDLIEKVQLLR